jgi:hypothetical protein
MDADAKKRARRTVERRAVEAAIWGMPIVSVDAMRRAFLRDAKGKYNDIAFFSRQADWRFQITTPNASSWYVYIPINLKNGPIVLEIPPAVGAGLFGNVNDAWQTPEADVGPTGEDGGKGGKYALLPPAFDGVVPTGYLPVRMKTYNGYSFLRAIPQTTASEDVAKALALVKQVRVYPLAQASNPQPQRFIDIAGKLFRGLVSFDESFYASLARMVDEEPIQERDLALMGQLRSLGIEKGKPFRPDRAMRKILRSAAIEARDGFIAATRSLPAFWRGRRWTIPATLVEHETAPHNFQTVDHLALDERGQLFFLGCAPAKKTGAATMYLGSSQDARGRNLDGGKTYHLCVPAHVPARQFWAVTVYDLETAGFVWKAPVVELNSYNQEIQRNADSTVDIYFGPTAPKGKKSNWIFTARGKPWFAIFRFYGPEKALFDKAWKLPDIIRS